MSPVEKTLRDEIKVLNGRLAELRDKREKLKVENNSLTTQIERLQTDKQTFLSALATLGYTT